MEIDEIVYGPSGQFRLEVTPVGGAIVYRVLHDGIQHYYEPEAFMATATGAVRFAEVIAATGDKEKAWQASGVSR